MRPSLARRWTRVRSSPARPDSSTDQVIFAGLAPELASLYRPGKMPELHARDLEPGRILPALLASLASSAITSGPCLWASSLTSAVILLGVPCLRPEPGRLRPLFARGPPRGASRPAHRPA